MTATATHIDTAARDALKRDKAALLAALRDAGATVELDGRKVKCPAHDDGKASAAVYQDDGGCWRVKCHTKACGYCGDIFDVRAFKGGKAELPMKPKPEGKRGFATCDAAVKWMRGRLAKDKGEAVEIAGEWDYANGLHVARFEFGITDNGRPDKTLSQFSKNGAGWLCNAKAITGPRPALYADSIRKASRPIVVEGEQKADALRALGFDATTFGAAKMSGPELSDISALEGEGRTVAILPDNDDDGEGFAVELAQRLLNLPKAPAVKIVRLPGLPAKGDCIDFIGERRIDGKDDAALAQELWDHIDAAPLVMKAEADAPKPKPGDGKPGESRLKSICIADVKPERVQWLHKGRWPLGKLGLLAGIQGKGKSFTTCDMAARVSRGIPFADTRDVPNPVGSVIFLAAEDGLADTLAPRLLAHDADTRKIHAIDGVEEVDRSGVRMFDLVRDAALLERRIVEIGDVRLVVVDPVDSYVGGKLDSNSKTDVRQVLAPLVTLAERYRICIVGVGHLSKSPQANALFKVCGSIAYTAVARAVHFVCDDPADPRRRLYVCGKMSVGKMPDGMAFTLEGGDEDAGIPPVVTWSAEAVTMTADDALCDSGDEDNSSSRLAEACDWLRELLAVENVKASDVYEQAEQCRIHERTLHRAKKALGIRSVKLVGEGKPLWWWCLPKSFIDGNVGIHGNLRDIESETHIAKAANIAKEIRRGGA